MGEKLKIIEVANELGLGGTEYAMQLYTKYLDKNIFDVTVVGIYKGGARLKAFEELCVKVEILNGNFDRLTEILKTTDVVHWHGSGSIKDSIAFFERIKETKPPLVLQTNVFGLYDSHPWYKDLIDHDLYISKMILVRRMHEDKARGNAFVNKRSVLPYPVDIDYLHTIAPAKSEVEQFKVKHGLNGRFVVGRLGRAADLKFDLITFDGFKELLKKQPKAKFLINGVTPKMAEYIKNIGIEDSVVQLHNTADLKELLLFYSAMNVFLACSGIGESFGMVMAEAMSMGVPVVTISTPERDNAQIEVVENGLTGFVVPRLKKNIGDALFKISNDTELQKRFSVESVKKIRNSYNAVNIVTSLQELILSHFNMQNNSKANSLLLNWSDKILNDYKKRLANTYGEIRGLDAFKLHIERAQIKKKGKAGLKKVLKAVLGR
jgi:glycosyltransferase involved in cell wall biosynthesis